jgi:hypothetical protein
MATQTSMLPFPSRSGDKSLLKLQMNDKKEHQTTIVVITSSISTSQPYRMSNEGPRRQLKNYSSKNDAMCKIQFK